MGTSSNKKNKMKKNKMKKKQNNFFGLFFSIFGEE